MAEEEGAEAKAEAEASEKKDSEAVEPAKDTADEKPPAEAKAEVSDPEVEPPPPSVTSSVEVGDDDFVVEVPLPRRVSEVMTRKVVTVLEDETLKHIRDGMDRFRFAHLPVVDAAGKLIGLVTHSDLLHASSSFLSEQAAERDAVILQLPVKRIMQREVITTNADEPLVDAARMMWDGKLGCLPVVDAENRIVGILTKGDFMRLCLRLLGGQRRPPPPSGMMPAVKPPA